jgi:propionyl-CoA carboxylase alpha chain
VQATIPAGWRNNRRGGQRAAFESALGRLDVEYAWTGVDSLSVTTGAGPARAVRLVRATPELVDLEIDGLRRTVELVRHGAQTTASCPAGSLVLTDVPRFPPVEAVTALGTLTAPMPGAVRTVFREVGERLEAGDPFLVMEAMKMEHTVLAPVTGRVEEILVQPGEQVEAGALLARIDDEDAG